MKKILLSIILMLLPLMASADPVLIDGIWYNLIAKGKVAEVTKDPSIPYGSGCYSDDIIIPSKVTPEEGVEYTVIKIADDAFSFCNDLTSVTIPNSVITIGNEAFDGCSGLTSFTIPNSVTSIGERAFGACRSLTSITIPNSVTSIGVRAFEACRSLTSITIPNSVTYIGESAFYYCSSLTSVTISNSVLYIFDHTFQDCRSLTSVTIPNSVMVIQLAAFYGCSSLTSVTIPNSVTNIGESAFSGCTGLKSVTIPNGVYSIGNNAFNGCSGLTSVTIPNSVLSIGNNAFNGCSGLASIIIGSGMENINSNAFANCPKLADVYCLADEVTTSSLMSRIGLYTSTTAFQDSYPQFMTLHVPAASIEAYRSTEPWSTFNSIVPLEAGDIPETQKCATPEISYENGMVKFTCETEGVKYFSSVTLADEHSYYDDKIQLSQKYKISVYATKTGYYNSETTTREIEIKGDNKPIVVGDVDGDGKVNVADHVKLSDIIMNQ